VHHQPVSWTKTFRGQGRVYYNNLGHNEATWDRAEFRTSLVDGIKWVSQVPLNVGCLTGSTPLPPPPTAPVPDPDSPLDPCALEPGETRLTYAGITTSPANPAAPVYFGKTQGRYVLDLSGGLIRQADVSIDLKWDTPTDDYDLAVTTPWGFAGSDALQPQSPPAESTRVKQAPHCSRLLLSVFNHHGITGRGLSLSLQVNAEPPPPAPPVIPGTTWVYETPPGANVYGFVPPAGVITEGGTAYLTNQDATAHNIACVKFDPVTRRPLCESPYANPSLPPETVPINGVDKLPPGTYDLLCQLHPPMTATLTVVDTVAPKLATLK
jgi:plastocyanin